jgi:hypothetical protein
MKSWLLLSIGAIPGFRLFRGELKKEHSTVSQGLRGGGVVGKTNGSQTEVMGRMEWKGRTGKLFGGWFSMSNPGFSPLSNHTYIHIHILLCVQIFWCSGMEMSSGGQKQPALPL